MENNLEALRKIFSEIASSCGVVSDVNYIGMGIYQGVKNGNFMISLSQMESICRLLDIEIPIQDIWDSEHDSSHCEPGHHQHRISI